MLLEKRLRKALSNFGLLREIIETIKCKSNDFRFHDAVLIERYDDIFSLRARELKLRVDVESVMIISAATSTNASLPHPLIQSHEPPAILIRERRFIA